MTSTHSARSRFATIFKKNLEISLEISLKTANLASLL